MRLPLNPAFGKALAPIVTECVTANSYYAPNTGRGIRAGIWAGAKMDSSCAPMVFDRGVVAPGVKAGYVEDANGNLVFPGTMSQLIIGTQPYLKVNKEGKRFANESVPYDFMNYAASLQTDGVYAAILPGNVTDDILAYDQYGCAQIAVNIAQGNGIIPMLEGMIEDGLVFKADTIEELAEKMGLPADTLAATVARYNELAQKGVDEDFLQRQLSGVLCRCGRRPHDDPGPLGCEGDFGKRVRTNGILNGIKKERFPCGGALFLCEKSAVQFQMSRQTLLILRLDLLRDQRAGIGEKRLVQTVTLRVDPVERNRLFQIGNVVDVVQPKAADIGFVAHALERGHHAGFALKCRVHGERAHVE